jgi:hypothetical protein
MARWGQAVLSAKLGTPIEFDHEASHADIEAQLHEYLPELFGYLDTVQGEPSAAKAKWAVCNHVQKRLHIIPEPHPDGNDLFINKSGNKASMHDMHVFIGMCSPAIGNSTQPPAIATCEAIPPTVLSGWGNGAAMVAMGITGTWF